MYRVLKKKNKKIKIEILHDPKIFFFVQRIINLLVKINLLDKCQLPSLKISINIHHEEPIIEKPITSNKISSKLKKVFTQKFSTNFQIK